MFLIIGLGNPGENYKFNRHNIGFMYLDYLFENNNFNTFKKKFNYFYSLNEYNESNIALIKPKTYMNLSGKAVVSAMAFFKVKINDLVIIYDDIALPFGKIRIRENGSAGGHNGLKSIENSLSSQEYKRIRIGIGAPDHPGKLISHVLGNFSKDEIVLLNTKVFPLIDDSIKLILNNNIKEAMNKYNGYDL